jgi:hypothetical protein
MFIYLDTETTGSGPEDKLCQIAFKTDGTICDELFNPEMPISVEAMVLCVVIVVLCRVRGMIGVGIVVWSCATLFSEFI